MRRIKIRGGIVAPAITPEALTFLRKLGYEFFKLEPRVEVFDSVSPQRPSEDQGVTQSAPE